MYAVFSILRGSKNGKITHYALLFLYYELCFIVSICWPSKLLSQNRIDLHSFSISYRLSLDDFRLEPISLSPQYFSELFSAFLQPICPGETTRLCSCFLQDFACVVRHHFDIHSLEPPFFHQTSLHWMAKVPIHLPHLVRLVGPVLRQTNSILVEFWDPKYIHNENT